MCYGRWATKGLMGLSQFHVEQMVDAFDIALDAVAGDGLAAGGADVAYLAKLFALADIGDVDLYRWNADGFHGVEQGDGGVGVGRLWCRSRPESCRRGRLRGCSGRSLRRCRVLWRGR